MNSEICLPLPPKYWDKGVGHHHLAGVLLILAFMFVGSGEPMSSGQLVGLALNTMWDPRTEPRRSGLAKAPLPTEPSCRRQKADSRQFMLEKDFLPDGTTLAESNS